MSEAMTYPAGADASLDLYAEQEEEMSEDEWTDSEDENFDPGRQYSNKELEEWADQLLREDANRELCRWCKEEDPASIPYGQETGEIEWQIQRDKDGAPLVDDEGQTLYVGFPELRCEKGHRWYKGEGPRRDIRGPNPILFETHLYNRKRREIHVKDGIPDPAFTMDRWGKRPTQGIYNRAHPQGRKINTPEQRAKNGASWYRAVMPLPLFMLHIGLVMTVILSIGLLLWTMWNVKQSEPLICESIIPVLGIEKRNENEIDGLLPLIESRPNSERSSGATQTVAVN